MVRNKLQDIIPTRIKKRNGQRKLVPKTKTVMRNKTKEVRARNSRWGFWVVIILAVLILVFTFSGLFAKAVITITPKQETIVLNGNFSAYRDAGPDELQFEVVSISLKELKEIEATGTEDVEKKASGEIIIFNDYSSKSQRLIKNTRFETLDGRIYKINKSVTVPGRTTEDGKEIPGSLEVTVYADQAGEEYNMDLSDFTIPGFKGDPRYKDFYARSKTPMTSGFSGIINIASEGDIENSKEELRIILKKKLMEQVGVQIPEGFILFEGAEFINFNEGEQEISEGQEGKVVISIEGVLFGVIFNKEKFAKFIAVNTLASYDDGEIYIKEIEKLGFEIINKSAVDLEDDIKIDIALDGNAHIVWRLNEDLLKSRLVKMNKGGFDTILTDFPYIRKAEAKIRPFWKRKFPSSAKRIDIELLD